MYFSRNLILEVTEMRSFKCKWIFFTDCQMLIIIGYNRTDIEINIFRKLSSDVHLFLHIPEKKWQMSRRNVDNITSSTWNMDVYQTSAYKPAGTYVPNMWKSLP